MSSSTSSLPRLVDRLVQSEGKTALSPKEAAEKAEVLLVIVINHLQVTSVLFQEGTGAVYRLTKNSAIIISSTVPGAYVQEVRKPLDNEYGRPDILLLDWSVSGGASGAADGSLTVFACGTDQGLSLANPVLQLIGSKIYRIKKTASSDGETRSGANGKVCHQGIPEIALALVVKVMALATRASLYTQKVYDHLKSGIGSNWVMKNRIPHALESDQTVSSAMTNSQKDSSVIVRTAGEKFVPVPLVATAEQIYQITVYIGWAGMDDSATWRLYLCGQPIDAVYQQTKIATDAKTAISLQDIEDIMICVHLAATAEPRAFTDAVGLNAKQMFETVCSAARWNVQYEKYALKMRGVPWYLQEIEVSKQIGNRLSKAVAEASIVGANLLIAVAAVQVFDMQVGRLLS